MAIAQERADGRDEHVAARDERGDGGGIARVGEGDLEIVAAEART
ncbi:hypothetical protein HRbin41_01530 [bacterium HR41]|nr:hypothetical protein HRbin41_01530 [bacterium HR41]